MKTTEYSGLADIEFLCKDEQIYLLEINPRMSGQIFTLINASSIYIDYLVLNYIYHLETGKNKKKIGKILENNDKKYNIVRHNRKLNASNVSGLFKFLLALTIVLIILVIIILFIKNTLKS